MIDTQFMRYVIDYMPQFLPRPRPKMDDRAESLKELGIIKEGYRVC